MTYPNTASRSFVPEYSTIEAIRVRTVWKESKQERQRRGYITREEISITDDRPYLYYEKMIDTPLIHEKTREELEFLLRLLKDKGQEEAFSYLRKEIKRRRKEKDFF